MNADNLGRSVCCARNTRNRECTRVRSEYNAVVGGRIECSKHIAFDLEVLDNGLNNNIGRPERLQIGCSGHAVLCACGLALGENVVSHQRVEPGRNPVESVLDVGLFDIAQHDLVAVCRRNLGNSAPHRAGADDTDSLDCRC
ncbi:MAG: hypothetical protein J07HX5_01841 [halophilic archaeon J07HX5]|nr:MAG: hypothetical protein J07HX5_01841 [halophilic archaeon J07HX5]